MICDLFGAASVSEERLGDAHLTLDLPTLPDGDCVLSHANRQDVASKPEELTSRKKQGHGLATVPCGPINQNRRMTTLCLAG